MFFRQLVRAFAFYPTLLAFALLFLATSSGQAAFSVWNVTTGNWSGVGNWSGGEPTSSSTAIISNGGTASITLPGEVCSNLLIGYNSGDTGAVNMTAGVLHMTNNAYIGYYGGGGFTQTSGTHSVGTDLVLGAYSGSYGSYTLSGTGTLSADAEFVGGAGGGTFNHSGGSNTTTDLYLGNTVGANGAYYLSAGATLNTGSEYIGGFGTGNFTQSGGVNTISSTTGLVLGRYSGSSGTYTLDSGTLRLKALSKGSGTAQFNIGNGVLQATGNLSSSLPITLSGSTAYVDTAGYNVTFSGGLSGGGALYKKGGGTLTLAGTNAYSGMTTVDSGTLAITGSLTSPTIENGYAIVTQSATSNVATQKLHVGSWGTGYYTLNGGTLSAGTEEVLGFYLGTGAFTQNSGSNSTGNLYLAVDSTGTGTYKLNSGSLSASTESVGQRGTATLTQTGGTNTITSASGLILGEISGSNGTYQFNGGTLSTTNETIGSYGTGSFTHTGGNNTASNALWLGYGTGTGSYNLSGTGYLNANIEYIGYGGTGTFTQNGGTNTANFVSVGHNPGNNVYTLNNGNLDVYGEYIGNHGNGTFTQNGGTHTVGPAGLCIGYDSGNGTYNLSGGTLVLSALYAASGAVQFNFGNGTLQAGDSFSSYLPMNLTGMARVDTAGCSVELGGNLTGNGSLTKNGAGLLTLSGTNSYAGDTYVSVGTLNVTGSLNAAGTVGVYDGAKLMGTGTVGAVNLDSFAGIAPGADGTIGVLTTRDLTLAADISLLFDLTDTASDLISLAGSTLSINDLEYSDFVFNPLTSLVAGTSYTLIDAATISGSLGTVLSGTLDGLLATLSLSTGGDNVLLTLRENNGVVPEPASLLIWAVGGVLALVFLKRRRQNGPARWHGSGWSAETQYSPRGTTKPPIEPICSVLCQDWKVGG